MKTTTQLLSAAILSAATLVCCVPAASFAEMPVTPALDNGRVNLALPAGITGQELKDHKGMENALSAVAEASFSRSSFADVVARTVDQDRDRLDQYKVNDKKDINDRAGKLDKAWKAKYGTSFDIDVAKAYPDNFAHFVEGEVSDTTQLVGKWPLNVNSAMVNERLNDAGKLTAGEANRIKDTTFGGDINLEKGRTVGAIQIPAGQGLPAVTASLVKELPATWRFDVPNTVTGQELHDRVLALQNYLLDNQGSWPADVQDAYRFVTHASVATLYGADMSKPAMATDK